MRGCVRKIRNFDVSVNIKHFCKTTDAREWIVDEVDTILNRTETLETLIFTFETGVK